MSPVPREADEQARAIAQTEFERPVLLTAGAGTGKTTALTARALAWCLDRGWEGAARELAGDASNERIAAQALDGVAAITFTEAGAAEMAARIASALALLATGTADHPALAGFRADLLAPTARAALADRARLLLGALDHLTAETIHAFCRRLLARHPLAAGIHPRIEVDAHLVASEEIASEVVERAVRSAYALPRSHPLIELAALEVGPDKLAGELLRLLDRAVPPVALARDPFTTPGIAILCGRLGAALDRLRAAGGERLAGVRSGSKALEVMAAWRASAQRLRAAIPADVTGLETWLAAVREVWDPALGALKKWSGAEPEKAFSQGERAALGEAVPAVQDAIRPLRRLLEHLLELAPRRLDVARRALAPLLEEATRICRARGVLTFSALLRGARDLLEEHPEVAAREQARLRQLLVDEFQDTDPLQCAIVRRLALPPGPGRPGLFLVGDAKQSIFGWREADLAVFERFRAELAAAGGVECELAVNFRSQPAILDEVERVVAPVMVFVPEVQPPYRPLVVGAGSRPPADGEGRRPAVEHWVSWDFATEPPWETRTDRSAELEAAAIAADLAAAHDEHGVAWREMALLLRSLTWVERYLDALRAAGVPYIVTRDRLYYGRREVIEAAALVRAVVDPLDTLALVTFLRSAAAGVPDAAWLPLFRRGLERVARRMSGPDGGELSAIHRLLAEAAADLPPGVPGLERIAGWQHSASHAFTVLAELRDAYTRLPTDRFIELLRQRSLYEASQAACTQGKFRLANLDRLFRRVESALAERGHDMAAIVRALRRSLKEAPDAPQALPHDAAEDVVQVLTIHKAKGLEFRHVYVAGLHTGPPSERGTKREKDRERDKNKEALFDPAHPDEYDLFGWPTPGADAIAERRRRTAAAELVRTLYVAMTRSRERIVLAGCWPGRLEAHPLAHAKSHLDLLLHRRDLPPSLADLAEECRAEGRDAVEAGGARWRFLGLSETRASAGRRPATALPIDLAELAVESRRLAQQREEALLHQALPFSRPVSAEVAGWLAALHLGRTEEGEAAPLPGARDAALLVGAAIHRLFETWDLGAEPARELSRQRASISAWLAARGAGGAAARRAESVLARLEAGDLLRRFHGLGDRIVARELPVLLPPDGGCVGFVAGAIDLLYRAADGGLVIADFKTDEVEGEAAIAERASAYGAQETLYARGLTEALALPSPPRAELWFLWPDRVWALD